MTRKEQRRRGPWWEPPYLVALHSRRKEIAEEIKSIKDRLAKLELEYQERCKCVGMQVSREPWSMEEALTDKSAAEVNAFLSPHSNGER